MLEISNNPSGYPFDNFGLGTLVPLGEAVHNIQYQPYEVSKLSMGVISKERFALDQEFLLRTSNSEIHLKAVKSMDDFKVSGVFRTILAVTDFKVDLEEVFVSSGCLERLAQVKKTYEINGFSKEFVDFRSSRFEVDPTIELRARTFGTQAFYMFDTVNASNSGVLIVAEGLKIPFRVNTLIEMNMDLRNIWIDEVMPVLGKVIRCSSFKGDSKARKAIYFGIQFVELTDEQMRTWRRGLEEIERHNTQELLISVKNNSDVEAS